MRTLRKGLAICLSMICLVALLGCMILVDDDFDSITTSRRVYEPPRIIRKVTRVKCGPTCADMLAAAQLEASQVKTNTFKQIASRPNLTAHEQVHLINIITSQEFVHKHWEPEDILQVMANNPTLTHSAKIYFSNNLDQFGLSEKHTKEIVKVLTRNPGVADPPEAGTEVLQYELDDLEITWCDHYGFGYEVVAELRSLGCSTEDTIIIIYLARYANYNPFIIARWYTVGRYSWSQIAFTKLRLAPSVFFVDLPETVEIGPPYGRAYGYYRTSPQRVDLSNEEIVHLIRFKGTSEACRIAPEEIINSRRQGMDEKHLVRTYRRGEKVHPDRTGTEQPVRIKDTHSKKEDFYRQKKEHKEDLKQPALPQAKDSRSD